MNKLAAVLEAGDVLVDVDAATRAASFSRAASLFERRHGMAEALVTDSLFERERLGSTALGHGVAFPHARIKGLKDAVAAVLRLRAGIAFDAPDEHPVRLLFFLFVPEAANQRHLEILAEIAEMLADRRIRDALTHAATPAALHGTIVSWRQLV